MSAGRQTLGYLRETAAAALAERGYDVLFRPAPHLLPEALRGLSPDAIAIGREPKLVVMVTDDSGKDAGRITAAKAALEGRTDWALHLFVYRPGIHAEPKPVASGDIRNTLGRVRKLLKDDPEAALLLGWAGLEAFARMQLPDDLARAQSASRIVETLAHEGIVTPTESDFLRSLASVRNAVAHGDLRERVNPADIIRMADLIDSLLASEAA